jgi:hypothetical protein
MSKDKFRFTDTVLLRLALEHMGMTRKQFQAHISQQIGLPAANKVATTRVESRRHKTPDGRPAHSTHEIYTTSTHNVETTQYGRVVRTEPRKPTPAQPTVVVKKRRRLEIAK